MREKIMKISSYFKSVKSSKTIEYLKKYKKAIVVVSLVLVSIILINMIGHMARPSIRQQELLSVGKATATSENVSLVIETELDKTLEKVDDAILIIVDSKKNPSIKEISSLIESDEVLNQSDFEVFYVQPVYDMSNIKKKYDISHKNTLIVYEEGIEKGRYSFDSKDGMRDIEEKINVIIDPLPVYYPPVREEVTIESVQEDMFTTTTEEPERVVTEEVIFE